jgi:hypothetical protein
MLCAYVHAPGVSRVKQHATLPPQTHDCMSTPDWLACLAINKGQTCVLTSYDRISLGILIPEHFSP